MSPAIPSSRAFGCRSTRIRPVGYGSTSSHSSSHLSSRNSLAGVREPRSRLRDQHAWCSSPSLRAITGSAHSASAPSAPLDPSPAEIAFLERVASEFAVAVESFLAKQEAVRERDRLRTLFDITNALVSKLDRDELFSAISDQLSKVIRHDCAVLTLCNQTGSLDVYALHSHDSAASLRY